MDNLFEQITNVSKAGAYDVLSKHNVELKEENQRLRDRVKYLENLIGEYTLKMQVNLSGGKVDEFLKGEASNPDDLPNGLFTQPKTD